MTDKRRIQMRVYFKPLSALNIKRIRPDVIVFVICLIGSYHYASNLHHDFGEDLGIYFVGANSIGPDFQLYRDFFDHKGPFWYLTIKLIGIVFSVNFTGIKTSIFIFAFIYGLSIYFLLSSISKSHTTNCLLTPVIYFSTLLLIPTNGILSIYIITICFFSVFLIYRSGFGENIYIFAGSSSLLSLAILSRVDSVIFVFLILGLISLNSPKNFRNLALKYTFLILFFLVFFLFLLSIIMRFSPRNYILYGVQFNYETYALEKFLTIEIPWRAAKILLASGIPLAITILLFNSNLRRRGLVQFVILTLGAGSIALVPLLRQDKDYYVFAFYGPAIVLIAVLVEQTISYNKIKSIFVILLISSLTSISLREIPYLREIYYTGNFLKHENLYLQMQIVNTGLKVGQVDYFIDAGIPYVLNQSPAKVNFNNYYPLKFNLGVISNSSRDQIVNNSSDLIWISVTQRESIGNKLTFADITERTQIILPSFFSESPSGPIEAWKPTS
jgi:hypothetical protein